MVTNGWPGPDTKQQRQVPAAHSEMKFETADGVLFEETRLFVLKVVKREMPRQIHKSHLGIANCRYRAREILFWPGMSVDVEQIVAICATITSLEEVRN